MGDVVADALDRPQQPFDLVHHPVGDAGEHVDLVAPPGHRQAGAEVALQYGLARRLDMPDPPKRAEAEGGPQRQPHQDDQGAAPQQRLQDDAAQARQDLGVEADEEDLARPQLFRQSPGAGLESAFVQFARDAVERRAGGQVTHIAGDPGALAIEQAVEIDVADVLGLGGADRLGQARRGDRLQGARLAGDDQVHLMGQIAGRAPVDQPQQGDHAGGEHQAIEQGQARGGGAPEFRASH